MKDKKESNHEKILKVLRKEIVDIGVFKLISQDAFIVGPKQLEQLRKMDGWIENKGDK